MCLAERRGAPMGQRKGRSITALALLVSEERRKIAGSKVDHLHLHKYLKRLAFILKEMCFLYGVS